MEEKCRLGKQMNECCERGRGSEVKEGMVIAFSELCLVDALGKISVNQMQEERSSVSNGAAGKNSYRRVLCTEFMQNQACATE